MSIELYLALLLHLFGFDTNAKVASLSPDQQTVLIAELTREKASYWQGVTHPVPAMRVEPFINPPFISAQAGIVVDGTTGKVLWSRNPYAPRSIASLTKLMTASVTASKNPDLDAYISLTPEDNASRIGSWLEVANGDRVTVRDVFAATLIGSMNNAARALAHTTGLTTEEFVDEMNATARSLGMLQTTFADPSGLDPANQSSPTDLVRLVRQAFSYALIRDMTTRERYDITTEKKRAIRVSTTNSLLKDTTLSFRGAKTGYLDEAGYTFAAYAERDGEQVIVVLMGSASSPARFHEAEALADWAFRTHTWFSFFTSPPR